VFESGIDSWHPLTSDICAIQDKFHDHTEKPYGMPFADEGKLFLFEPGGWKTFLAEILLGKESTGNVGMAYLPFISMPGKIYLDEKEVRDLSGE